MKDTKPMKRKSKILIVAAIIVVLVGYQSITNLILRAKVGELECEVNQLKTELLEQIK